MRKYILIFISSIFYFSCVTNSVENNNQSSEKDTISKNNNQSSEKDSIKELEKKIRKEKKIKQLDSLYQIVKQSEKNIKLKYDDMGDEVKIIKSKSYKYYSNVSQLTLSLQTYPNSLPLIFLRINYSDDDWLFINKYLIKTDSTKYTFFKKDGEYNSEVLSGGKIKETISINITPYDEYKGMVMLSNETYNKNVEKYNLIKEIINSQKPKIRYNGKQYYSDRVMWKGEKNGLKEVINYYENYIEFYKQKTKHKYFDEIDYQNW